jgi:hypothetical protein
MDHLDNSAPPEPLRKPPAAQNLGPAMRALSPNLQIFVHALVETGGNKPEAARLAGCQCSTTESFRNRAIEMLRNQKVQDAVLEEGKRVIGSLAIQAAEVLGQFVDGTIACPPGTRLRALEMAMNRIGMHAKSEHEVTVKHEGTDKETIEQIIVLAKAMQLDPRQLLGRHGIVLDAEFTVVEEKPKRAIAAPAYTGREGLEDLLG